MLFNKSYGTENLVQSLVAGFTQPSYLSRVSVIRVMGNHSFSPT